MANTGTMIEVPAAAGRKLKVKKNITFFGGELTLTKEGWLVRPPEEFSFLEGFFLTLDEAEEAMLGWLREENLRHARTPTFVQAPGCRREKTREDRPSFISEHQLKRFLPYLLGCPAEISPGWYESQIDIWLRGQKLDQLAFASYYASNSIDGGQAVAVKVDSLGRASDYLSLADYVVGGQQLPDGDWHYFM